MFGYPEDELSSMLIVGALVVISIAGLMVNAFLLRVLKKLPENSTSFQIIKAVAATDLFLCGFTLAVCTFRPILGFRGAFASRFYCPVLSSLTFFFSSISGILMAFLAIERYCVICRQRGLPRLLIWGTFALICLVFAILMGGNSLIGGFAPEPAFIFCMPKGTEWSFYAFYVLLNAPIIILTFCYTSIFVKCYRASIPNQAESITKKAAIQSLLVLTIYFFCYIPKFSTTLIGILYGLDAPPRALYMLIPIGMTLLAIVNPILVLSLHRQIKIKAKTLLFHEKPSAIRLK